MSNPDRPSKSSSNPTEHDHDFVGVETALKRAAQKVWEHARQTGGCVVVWRDGQVVHVHPGDTRREKVDHWQVAGPTSKGYGYCENLSNRGYGRMVMVNFSIPDEVNEAFNRTFEGQNKSDIIAELMRKAVEEADQQKRRQKTIRLLTERRALRSFATDEERRQAREEGRP
jgi:hypothetical protein